MAVHLPPLAAVIIRDAELATVISDVLLIHDALDFHFNMHSSR
jgi:hypothetical protein